MDFDLSPIDTVTDDLAQNILNEQDPNKVKDLTQLFNLNQSKKNVLRVLKLSQLLDKISDQMYDRIDKRAGEFSNIDLLNYMTTISTAIDKANKSLDLVAQNPAIQLSQQNINIEINNQVLDRASRQHITDAVQAILNKAVALNVIQEEEIPTQFIDENKNITEETIDG